MVCFLMVQRPTESKRTATLLPFSALFRSLRFRGQALRRQAVRALHRGEGPGFDGHILQKQPGLHRGIKSVGMECELGIGRGIATARQDRLDIERSEETTSDLQSLMRT